MEQTLKKIRILVSTLGCFVLAGIIIWKTYTNSPPMYEDLERIEATVTEVSIGNRRNSNAEFPVLRLQDRSEAFAYLDWFPNPEVIWREIIVGDQVILLSDTDRNAWIWELHKDGRAIVSYRDVFAAVHGYDRYYPLIAFVVVAVGIYGVFRLKKLR